MKYAVGWKNKRNIKNRRVVMPDFGSPFSGLANPRKLTYEELI